MRRWVFLLLTLLMMTSGSILGPSADAAPTRTDCYGDPLPPGALARMGSIRFQQADGVDCAVFSPDGKLLVAASPGKEGENLHFWDVKTGRELRRVTQKQALPFDRIAFSPNGKLLAGLSGHDPTIWLWDSASGASLGAAVRHRRSIATFAFSPDGTKIAAAGEYPDGVKEFGICLWDLETGEKVRVFDGHRTKVHDLAFTADGKTLLSASLDQRVHDGQRERHIPPQVCVWDVTTGKLRHRYQPKDNPRFSSNGQTFFFHDKDTIHVCDAAAGHELWSTPGDWTLCVYSPNGRLLVTGRRDRSFSLWEPASGQELRRFWAVGERASGALCLSSDGATLATSSDWGFAFQLWDTRTGQERRPFGGHRDFIICLDFAPDDRTLVSGSWDGTVRLWETATGKEQRVFHGSKANIRVVAFSPDGKTVAWGDSQNVVRLRDVATGADRGRFCAPLSKRDPYFEGVQSLAFSPDGRRLAIGSGDGAVYFWEMMTGKPPRRWETQANVVPALTLSADGKVKALLVTYQEKPSTFQASCEVWTWEGAAGRPPQRLCAWKGDMPWSAAFSPDAKVVLIHLAMKGGLIAFGGMGDIRLRESATGGAISLIETEQAGCRPTFSPNGNAFFADGVMWDVAGKRRLGEVGGHLQETTCVACSPDGRLVATGSRDTTILVHPTPPVPRNRAPRELSKRELQALWADLASSDSARAWRAVHQLAAAPDASVPFLQSFLRPHPSIDQDRLARLLADLDSDRFQVREQARGELNKLGELAEPALRRTLEGKPSLEVRRQALALLEQIEPEGRSPETLRVLRVTAALERMGTSESVELLRRLAAGAPEARLSHEAAGALQRLERRTVRPRP